MLFETGQGPRHGRVADHLHPRDRQRVELRIERAAGRTSGYLEHRVVRVGHGATFRVAPRAAPRQLTVRRPHAERKRERAYLVARYGGIDRHLTARDILLDLWTGAIEAGVVERVIAELESLIREKLHLLVPPLGLLPFDVLVTEEGAARLSRRQHAKDRAIPPIGVGLVEGRENTHGRARIDLQFAVLLDVRNCDGDASSNTSTSGDCPAGRSIRLSIISPMDTGR
jgi:hypothetical protein